LIFPAAERQRQKMEFAIHHSLAVATAYVDFDIYKSDEDSGQYWWIFF
jgi:hypothetical protein